MSTKQVTIRHLSNAEKITLGCSMENACTIVSDGDFAYHVTTFEDESPNLTNTIAVPCHVNGYKDPKAFPESKYPRYRSKQPNHGLGVQNAILMLQELPKDDNESNDEDDVDDVDEDGYEKCPPGECGACDNEPLSCRNPNNPETGDGDDYDLDVDDLAQDIQDAMERDLEPVRGKVKHKDRRDSDPNHDALLCAIASNRCACGCSACEVLHDNS